MMRRSLAALVLVASACGTHEAVRAPTPPSVSLDAKLAAQWQRFADARALLLRRVVDEGGTVSREEWERILATAQIGAEDLAMLRARHARIVADAETASRAASRLDLDRLRASGDIRAFCKDLPKGGMLHVHAGGTRDRSTIRGLLEKLDPVFPAAALARDLSTSDADEMLYPDEIDGLTAIARAQEAPRWHELSEDQRRRAFELFFLPRGTHRFERFAGTFAVLSTVFRPHREAVDAATYPPFFERAKSHHVRFVELSRSRVSRDVDAWAERIRADYGVEVRIQAAFLRDAPLDENRRAIAALLATAPSRAVTAINIMGDEARHPALESAQTLYAPALAASQRGTTALRRTMHAGEHGDPRNPRDALIMGAERLGHAVRLRDDPVTLERARLDRVPVEANLLSNVRLRAVASVREHPFLFYLRLGLPVSFSTDDEGLFESTVDDECVLAITETSITYDELRRTSFAAVETAFVDEATRLELRARVASDFEGFEARWAALARR
jgi:adenosine deaminase